MADEHWPRVTDLMHRALEVPAGDRHEWLESQSGGDSDLLAEVRRLLQAHDDAGRFLEQPLVAEDGSALALHDAVHTPPGASIGAGTAIGHYRILRELGRGGMGTVYLGARADDVFEKQVAIKVVPGALVSDALRERFARERQLLAALDHPGIARVLDGGATASGLQYLVMEYVDGAPIDAYCEARQLDVAARLRLFVDVCRAVHYAHDRLTVHRDIKPTNVLVGEDGRPKLLDFGIAKLLARDQSPGDPGATSVQAWTPESASPEQVRGEITTVATDVYGLGALLYRLLAGRPVFDLVGRDSVERVRIICEATPERPSVAAARAGDGARGGAIAADLDAIVLKALHKEPARRYQSAEHLAEDVERHLAHRPVLAAPDRWTYRASKFVGRHPVATAASVVAVVAVLAATATALWQARRANLERDLALAAERRSGQETELARQVSRFLLDLFKVSDPSEATGNRITAREILDKGSDRIASELKDQPAVQARLMDTIGRVYGGLGLHLRAAPLLEDALAIRRRTLGTEHPEVAETLHNLGELVFAKGDLADAERLLRNALEIRRKTLGDGRLETTETQNSLAIVLRRKETPEAMVEAEQLYRTALATRRRLLGQEHPAIAQNLVNLGMLLYSNKRDYAGAEPLFREALDLNRRLLGQEHLEVGTTLNNLALLVRDQGRYQEAEPLFRQALMIFLKVLGEEHPDVAAATNNLANLFQRKGDYAEAESLYRTAIERFRKIFPENHWQVATVKSLLGGCLTAARRYREAEPPLLESYPIIREAFGDSHNRTRVALRRIVDLYDAWGKPDKAAKYRVLLPRTGTAP